MHFNRIGIDVESRVEDFIRKLTYQLFANVGVPSSTCSDYEVRGCWKERKKTTTAWDSHFPTTSTAAGYLT